MTDENLDRQMEFMLQQQAEHVGRMQQLEELVVNLARTKRDRFEGTDQTEPKENGGERQKTDEALRRLITVVDRYLSEGRNGNS